MTTYTTPQLIEKLYSNLRTLAPIGAEHSYISGYLYNALQDIAEHGMDELVAHVDWTNQRVEAFEYNKRADARRAAFENGEYA